MTFEESQNKLEEIIAKLQGGELSLEEGEKLFTEGVSLVKKCYEHLEKSKGKIEIAAQELEAYANEEGEE